jgi:DNA-binding transcriptional MocR family regulator
MTTVKPNTKTDRKVRLGILRFVLRTGRMPGISDMAKQLRIPRAAIRAALRRLAEAHAIVLQPRSDEILRAAPFWGVPTAFQVEVGKRRYWASCIWDALGVPAMLRRDARIFTACGCCDSRMGVEVKNGRLVRPRGVIHIAVPARHWYDDIVFT